MMLSIDGREDATDSIPGVTIRAFIQTWNMENNPIHSIPFLLAINE